MKPKYSYSKSPKAPAEQVVKDIRRQARRHFSAEDKIRIVLIDEMEGASDGLDAIEQRFAAAKAVADRARANAKGSGRSRKRAATNSRSHARNSPSRSDAGECVPWDILGYTSLTAHLKNVSSHGTYLSSGPID
ncbi:MAG: hypothetical protein AB7D33_11515 [Sphingobium sp.]